MADYLTRLNPEQRGAVETVDSTVGAGAALMASTVALGALGGTLRRLRA